MIDAVALLLADPSPVLRCRALVEVDGVERDDPEVVALESQISASTQVVDALASPGDGPQDLSFTLTRLAYFGIGRGYPATDEIAERIFAAQRPDGTWDHETPFGRPPPERYEWRPLQVALPLRGLAAAGYATDPRAEKAYEWLLAHRFEDGSWPYGKAAGQKPGAVVGYRRLPRSEGCRATTTGALACLVHHPQRRASEDARAALDLLLARETRDEWALGAEVSRLLGVERPRGFATFYARFDLAFVLDLASRAGASLEDPRVSDLVAFLESRRGPYGLWDHPSYPHLSRWLTLDLLASMRRLKMGDWTGTDLQVSFRAYPKRRRRH